jgi:hypothetical protein
MISKTKQFLVVFFLLFSMGMGMVYADLIVKIVIVWTIILLFMSFVFYRIIKKERKLEQSPQKEELDAIKEVADESWHVAIEDVKERLVTLAKKESKKSPTRRKVEKNGWWITILLIGIVVVSLKWYWLVNVSDPIETSAGVAQRAATLEKLLDYDDTMDTRVRRGGWLKGILLWPAEPTEEEIKYAAEFLWTAVEMYDYLQKENSLCNTNLSYNANDGGYKDEIAIAQVAIDYVNNTQEIAYAESGLLLLRDAYVKKYPCQ